MGTIVCAVDSSPEAEAALRTTAKLCREWGLRLVLVHVEPRSGLKLPIGGEAHERGRELLDGLAENCGLNGTADKRYETGDRASEVARVAAEEAASVIVVGSRSRHWWQRRLNCGLAADLNATATCPVVVVPSAVRR